MDSKFIITPKNIKRNLKEEEARLFYSSQSHFVGMADMFLNMAGISKFGTMKPERLLTDVLSIRLINPTTFQLEVKEDGVTRYVDYEVEDKKYANQIVAKIKYLK